MDKFGKVSILQGGPAVPGQSNNAAFRKGCRDKGAAIPNVKGVRHFIGMASWYRRHGTA